MGFADKYKKPPTSGGGNADGKAAESSSSENNSSDTNVSGGFSSRFNKREPIATKPEDIVNNAPGENKSFTEGISQKRKPSSFTDQVTRRSDLVYLVHGKDRGRDAWHYVLVDQNKLPMFLKQIETGTIDVALYGKVLRSGWGKEPPEDVKKAIEEEFS